jgi:hypothetical protein
LFAITANRIFYRFFFEIKISNQLKKGAIVNKILVVSGAMSFSQ